MTKSSSVRHFFQKHRSTINSLIKMTPAIASAFAAVMSWQIAVQLKDLQFSTNFRVDCSFAVDRREFVPGNEIPCEISNLSNKNLTIDKIDLNVNYVQEITVSDSIKYETAPINDLSKLKISTIYDLQSQNNLYLNDIGTNILIEPSSKRVIVLKLAGCPKENDIYFDISPIFTSIDGVSEKSSGYCNYTCF